MEPTPNPVGKYLQFGLPLAVLCIGVVVTGLLLYGTRETLLNQEATGPVYLLHGILLGGLLATALLTALSAWLIRRYTRVVAQLHQLASEHEKNHRTLQNKHIEKEVLSQALSDSEQRTRDFIRLSDAFAFELDEQGRIGFISSQIHYWRQEAPASLAREPLQNLIPEKERPHLEQALGICLRERKCKRLHTWLVCADGTHVPVTVAVCPVSDPLNQCLGFRGLGWEGHDSRRND